MQDPANPVPPMIATMISGTPSAPAAPGAPTAADAGESAETPLDHVLSLEKRIAELEAVVNRWTPTIGELVTLGENLRKEGHSVGSVVAEVATRLLGLLAK